MLNIKKDILIVISMLLALGSSGCFPQVYVNEPTTLHDIEESELQLLWMRSDVFALQNNFDTQISAGSGLLCVLGDVEYPPEKAISCIDGISNEVKWQKAPGNAMGILVASDGVYVTYKGFSPGIDKYDHEGGLIWSRTLTGNGIIYFYHYNNLIELFLHPERFLILSAEREDEIENTKDVEVILKTSTEVFTKNAYLESKDLNSEKVNWSLEIGNSIRLKPLFTDDYIFLRTGRVLGSTLAVDRKTGNILLNTEKNVISNVVYLPKTNQAVVLTENGVLLAIDMASEQQTQLADFSNPPFVLNGDANVGGYELAFDEEQSILFVLLGDSRQLYAFQVK